jgi:hypothetical protein
VYLQYVRVGRAIMVSEVALNQFFVALAQADKAEQHPVGISPKRKSRRINSAARQRSIDEANAILIRAGIIRPMAACSVETESQLEQEGR